MTKVEYISRVSEAYGFASAMVMAIENLWVPNPDNVPLTTYKMQRNLASATRSEGMLLPFSEEYQGTWEKFEQAMSQRVFPSDDVDPLGM